MKVFLFHCWGGNGRSCWSGWLADRMREKGVEVIAPDFPNPSKPWLPDWLAAVRARVEKFDGEWVLVGHSLGCPTILRLLESFGEGEKAGTVILVAGFAKDLHIPELQNFIYRDFDWEKIREGAGRFIVISSDNDPFIELEEGRRLAGLLEAEFIIERGAGHINEGSGFTSYPRLLELVEGPGAGRRGRK